MKLLALCIGLAVVFGSGKAARTTFNPDDFSIGPEEINVDDPRAQSAAKFATTVISDGFKGSYQLGLIRVTKAIEQVVAGFLYTLTLAAGRTNCTKGSNDNAVCKVSPGADNSSHVDYNECKVGVWDKDWLTPRYKITELKCNKPNKNEVPPPQPLKSH